MFFNVKICLQIRLHLNKTNNANSFFEVHQRNQSKMNQKWKYSNLQYYLDPTVAQDTYLTSSIQKKVKTRNYTCDESNTIQVTNCLDEYYMKQLNCSFPWIKTEFQDLKMCWSKHYIDDLKELVKNVSKIHVKHSEEVEHCLVPNCVTTKWKTLKKEKMESEECMANFIIDSTMVNYDFFSKIIIHLS